MVSVVTTDNYKYGIIDSIEAHAIPRGAASASLNWMTKGDHIELRPGQIFLGTSSVQSGLGKATGLKKLTDSLGIELLVGSYGQKLKYFDNDTEEWVEYGTNLLGSAVVDDNGLGLEDIFIEEYVSPAGNQAFVNSPSIAGYFKLLTSNPGSSLNVYDSSKNFKGYIKIDTNRTLLWGRKTDKTGVYGSYIDSQSYTTVTSESVGTGDGSTTTFTGTLAAITGTRTVFGVSVTAGSVTLTDDFAGNLSADDGSTGTINYITGAFSVTFATAPANLQAVTATYQWEDSNAGGITDFTKSAPRTAGQGFVFRQDEGGGAMQNISTYNQVYYCLHRLKTWLLNITSTDTNATNLPFRQKVGIPNVRASVETGDGIYYIDDTDKTAVRMRLLSYDRAGSQQVIPFAISKNINLNDYLFEKAASREFGDYILFACATKNSVQEINGQVVPVNNRVLVFNKLWKSWDVLDYAVTCFEVFNGALIAGHSISNNFAEIFSGTDDFDTEAMQNYWIGKLDNLDVQGLKKSKKFKLEGRIGVNQKIKVSISIDNGPWVEIGSSTNDAGEHVYAIEGTGSYVDKSQSVTIGSFTFGRKTIGGGSGGVTAYNYERLVPLNVGKAEYIMVRYEAMANGYASVSNQSYWDVRFKGRKVPVKYRG